MGKSSGSKAEVVEYTMSIHVGVGHELDAVTEVRVDEKVAWRGNVTTNTAIGINSPNLFGGQRKEGGLVGTMQVLMGREDQVLPAAAAARYRLAPNDCPAHRGVTTLMFHGSGAISTGRLGEWDGSLIDLDAGFGQTYSNSGFLWKMNSPVIAQKIEVTGVRAPKGLDPATAMVGPDANPIHIIYECLVNDEWGMAGAAALIDKAGFEVEAIRLRDEGFGISLWWMRQQTIEAFVTEILDHIQATIFVNPNTGLLSVKLLRDDYDIATLRHITPDNATLSNFKRRSSGEIVNEMTVSFTNPITEKAESITAQDIASIESQDGQKVAGSRDYYGIRNRELAGKVLARDLRASTAPLISAEAKLDRSAWDVLPGEVMLLSWPRRNANAVVVRAGKVSYGKPKDSAIRVSLMQDVFSLSKPAITVMPSTGWEDPTVDPQPLTMRLFTVPSFFARNAEMQGEVVALGPNEALVGALADSETHDSFDYELVSESVTANGDTVITSKGGKSMTPLAYLSTTMEAAAASVVPFALFPIAEETPRVGGFVFIGYGDSNQEVALVTGRTTTGWTISRGVLDTVPKTWAPGTPLWLVNPGTRIVDTQTIYAEGSTAIYRGLDRTARGLLGYEDAPSISTVVTDRAHLPLRPANVRLNGVGFGSTPIGSASAVQLTWSIRNRLVEDSVVQLWTDSSVQPEYRQETVVSVYDATNDALLREYPWLWTETGVSFPRARLERYAALRFVVSSRRDESVSLTGHAITVTGLAGDPLAEDLPATVGRTEPPSFYPAPGYMAFGMAAVQLVGTDGSHNPSIEVSGIQDIPEPQWLICRYRPIFETPVEGEDPILTFGSWTITSPHPLNREAVTFSIPGLLGETIYEVQCAYFRDGEIGAWRDLGRDRTGQALATIGDDVKKDIVDELKKDVKDLIDDLDKSEDVAELVLETILNEQEALEAEAHERLKADTGVLQEARTYTDDLKSQVDLTFYTRAQTDAGMASTLQYAQAYTDDVKSESMLLFSTKAERASGDALSVIQAKAYTDDYKSQADLIFATQAALGEGLAETLSTSQSYTNGHVASAMDTVYTKAQVNDAVATTLQEAKSYTDEESSAASLLYSTKAETEAAKSVTLQEAKSYTDDVKAEADLTYATQSSLGGVNATAGLALSTAQDAATKLNEARVRMIAEASGSDPAVFELYSGTGAASFVRLAAAQILFGNNTVLDDATDQLRTITNGVRRVSAWGASFGADGTLTEWEGPDSVADGAMSRANAFYYRANVAPYFGGSALPGQGFHAQADFAVRVGTRTTAGLVTTSAVTIATSGATGTVTYAWSQIGGNDEWTIVTPSGATTTFRVNVATPGEIKRAQFACLVTDTGSGRSFTIIVGGAAIYNV